MAQKKVLGYAARDESGRLSPFEFTRRHETVEIVCEVGSKVKGFKVGYHVGVGCMVGSCGKCDACEKRQEQYCEKIIFTYNSVYHDGTPTYGGYSTLMVVDQK